MKSQIKILILAVSLLILNSACTSFPIQRSAATGYASYTDSDYREVSLNDLSGRNDDFSIKSYNSAPTAYKSQNQRKTLESSLETQEEKRQYLRYKPYLSEDERLDFLQLDDVAARERWIQAKGINFSPDRHSRSIASLVEQNDIALGMEKEAVKDSWGDPDYVEVSGNPRFENERWRFSTPVQTSEGYQIEERFVYFEGGRVVGWSSR